MEYTNSRGNFLNFSDSMIEYIVSMYRKLLLKRNNDYLTRVIYTPRFILQCY